MTGVQTCALPICFPVTIVPHSWDSYDSDAGENELGGYALFNLKYANQLHKNVGLTIGIDNIFDKTYASTNMYKDIMYATSTSFNTQEDMDM